MQNYYLSFPQTISLLSSIELSYNNICKSNYLEKKHLICLRIGG